MSSIGIIDEIEYATFHEYPNYRFASEGWAETRLISGPRENRRLSNRWRRLKGTVNQYGREQIGLVRQDGKQVTVMTHVAILQAFRGAKPDGMIGCHNDGNKRNNRIDNLRWDTPKSNSLDMVRHGNSLAGSKHHRSKLKESDVLEIRRLAAENRYTRYELADMFGVVYSSIQMIVTRATWKHI